MTTLGVRALVLALLASLCGVLGPVASAATPGTISGTVTVLGTGQTTTRLHTQAAIQVLDQGAWTVVENAYTDQRSGTYASQPLAPGTYRVEFSNMDHITQVSAPVTVTGEAAVVVDAALDPGARIQGRFTVPDGVPLPDGWITVHARQGGHWVQVDNDLLAPDRTYTVGGLTGGTYKVAFGTFTGPQAPEFYDNVATLDQAREIAVAPGSTVTGIDVELSTTPLPAPAPTSGPAPTEPPPGPTTGPTTAPAPGATAVAMDGRVRLVGPVRVGRRVRATVVLIEPAAARLRYTWRLDGRTVRTTDRSSFRPTRAMQGKRLSVEVRATAPGLAPALGYSVSKRVRGRGL